MAADGERRDDERLLARAEAALTERPQEKPSPSIDDLMSKTEKPKRSRDDLLG
jgi:hypothetical protein